MNQILAPPPLWQTLLAEAVRSRSELIKMLELDGDPVAGAANAAEAAERDFPIRIPRSFVARMRSRDPSDPLLLQVLAQASEMDSAPGYGSDPLAEMDAMPIPGLLHKYASRVLVITTGVCGVHCRYCFRKTFPYSETVLDADTLERMRHYVQQHTEISEVIFSGGDPLSLADERLSTVVDRLTLPNIRRLRIHTRMPIVLPERVDESLVRLISSFKRPITIVVHCNHPNELNGQTADAFRLLKAAGATLFNQSVLLRRINDDPRILIALSESLFEQGVIPYYLNLLDRVTGTSHYAVSIERARDIMTQVQQSLSGYLVPKLVYEEPKALSKLPVATG